MSAHDEHDQSAEIVAAARQRGLARSPMLRVASIVLWSAFIGATCSLVVFLLLPDQWLLAPISFIHLAALFVVSLALALIPAISAATLCSQSPSPAITEPPVKDQGHDSYS